ncbi:hypothetical protein Golob_003999, partial [Gossypium lobatum]|nr:hypothetical protein [Gossypium lobatum]
NLRSSALPSDHYLNPCGCSFLFAYLGANLGSWQVLHELLGEVGVIASWQLIHEIIDAFEDGVAESKKKSGGAKGYFGGSKRTESKSAEASSSSKSCGGEVCWDDGEEEGSSEG